jgi:hypothetical protein
MSVVISMGKFNAVQTEYAIKDNLSRDSGLITAHNVVGTLGTMTDLMRKRISKRLSSARQTACSTRTV